MDECESEVDHWKRRFNEQTQALTEERKKREKAEEAILFMRNEWTDMGGRGCPACHYENGKFIKLCKIHEIGQMIIKKAETRLKELESYLVNGEKGVFAKIKALEAQLEHADNVLHYRHDHEWQSHKKIKDLQAKLTEAEGRVTQAHKVFGHESDKLGETIKSLAVKAKRMREATKKAIEQIEDGDNEDTWTILQQALKDEGGEG